MAITRSQLLKELEPGLNALFGMEYDRYDNEHKEIFDTETSERAFEEEVMLYGFAQAPAKGEGSAITYDNAGESFTARYTHETIALAFAITEEAVEDNLYDKLSSRYTRALARSMSNTKQVKAAAVLNNAFDSTYKGGDGVSLVNSAHPTALGGNFSNTLATAADLNETSLEQALIDISLFIDERGMKIALQGVKLIIPPTLQFTTERLLKSEQRTGTSDNDINAIKSGGYLKEGFALNHFLTDPDAWFIKTDAPNGLKHFERSALKTAMEGDFETGNVRYKARERYSFGWSDPRAIYASPGAP